MGRARLSRYRCASAGRNMEQCVRNATLRRTVPQSGCRPLGPPRFPSLLTKRRGHPSTTGTTTTTTDELFDDNPAPFCSASLAPSSRSLFLSSSPLLPITDLPAYRYLRPTRTVPRIYNLHHYEQPIQRLTFSLHPLTPLASSFLSCRLSPSDSTASSLHVLLSATVRYRTCSSHSVLSASLLFFSLLVSRFIACSLTVRPFSLSCRHRLLLFSHPYHRSGSSSSNPRIDFTLPTAQVLSLGR